MNYFGRGIALRIAFGFTVLVLVMAGGAGATKFITNDATGGDCTSFGTWNAATMTCTMTTDLTEGIQIDSNGVTLDGNGHTITGNGGGGTVGVFLSGRSGVTIKNINIKNNYVGINLVSSNNNILSGNNATSNSNSGIALSSSSNNILSNNNASSNNCYGIQLPNSNNNILSSNNFSNERIGIYMSGSNYNTLNSNDASNNMAYGYASIYLIVSSDNTLSNNNASNNSGGGIYLSSSSNNTLSGNNASNNDFGIYLSTSNDNMLSGNTANSNKGVGISLPYSSNKNTLSNNNANSNNGDGIYLIASNNMLSNNNANSNNNYGIHLYAGSNNMLNNNNANSNNLYYGIYLHQTNNNTLSGNNASKNNYGIYLFNSRDNTLKGNNASSNYNTGIYLYSTPPYSFSNNIYNNYFNNTINYGSTTGNATWNTTRTSATNIIGGPYIGGNFWANPGGTGYSQTCPDADNDGICDAQYTLDSNNIDYLPLAYNLASIPIQVMNPGSNPAVILNDNGRARPPGTNITRLNVTVSGNVASVTINLSAIGGSSGTLMTRIPGTDIYTITTTANSCDNFPTNLLVNATDTSGNFNNSVGIPLTVLLPGDVNFDCKIDLKDILFMRRYFAGLEPLI
jgi:parallel beta-helix repeat protein